jgi:PAS domain S-box-containing protein
MSRFETLRHNLEDGLGGGTEGERALRQQVLVEQKRTKEAQARLAAIVEALHRATERLELAQEAAEVGTFEWDMQSNEVTWSASMEKLYGVPPGGFGRTYESWRKMVHPQDLPAIEAAACQAVRTRKCWEVEFRIIRPDGAVRWIAAKARVLPGEHGAPGHVLGINTDITERKETEEALRQSEAYFRQLANTMPQIVWVARPDGLLHYYNQRWYEFTGFAPGAGDHDSWRSVLHPEDVQHCLGAWRAAVESGQPFQTECRLRDYRTGRYRWFLARALPVRNEQGQIIRWFGTSTDIEDQKQAEAAVAEARDHLEQVVEERTAELRRTVSELEAFCYSLSHDMRGPLRAIQSYIQIVLQRCQAQIGSPEKEFMQKSISAAHRMDQLIQDVLAFSRLSRQEVTIHAMDVDRLAREIIHERPEFQPPHAEVRVEGPLLPMLGHEALLTQCLTNLLGNAVKFVARGVKPQVRIYSQVAGDKVRLWVEDNGIGIEKGAQQKLFGLFQRLHRDTEYEGTGVGLAIVRRAAERMGGQVGVESEPGRGSRLWVELRRAE